MTDTDAGEPRPEPPFEGTELQTLTGFLEFQRATFAWKTAALDTEQLSRTVGMSTMTLDGMLKHLAYVEDNWFGRWLFDEPPREPWTAAIKRARAATERAASSGDLGRRADRTGSDGRSPTVRWILTHMIEEYARHNGHADLIRESIDGAVGE